MEIEQIIKLIQEVSNSNLWSFKYTEGNLSLELSKYNNNTNEVYKQSRDAKQFEDAMQSEDAKQPKDSKQSDDVKQSENAKLSEGAKQAEDMIKSKQVNEYAVRSNDDGQIIEKNIYKDKEKDTTDKYIIKSPIVGTFYSAPSDESEPYIEVGDRVKKGQVIAIIEAMKIMNEIESTVDGVVHEILVNNQDIVEFGQPLIVIKP